MAKAKRNLRAHLRKAEFSAVGMCVRLGAAPNSAVQRPHSAVLKALTVRSKGPLKGQDYAFSRCPQPKSLLAPERRRVCDILRDTLTRKPKNGWVTYSTCLRTWATPRLQVTLV